MDKVRQRTVRGTQMAAQGTKKAVQSVTTALRIKKKSSLKDDDEEDTKKEVLDAVCPGDESLSGTGVSPDGRLKNSDADDQHLRNISGSTSPPIAASSSRAAVVEVGPVLEFLTADTTLFWIFCLVAAIYPTVQHIMLTDTTADGASSFIAMSMPLSVVGPWLVLAFATGQIAGQWTGTTHYGLDLDSRPKSRQQGQASVSPTASSFMDPLAVTDEEERMLLTMDEEKTRKHSLFMSLVGSRAKIRFTNIPQTTSQLLRRATSGGAWTTLKSKRSSSKVSFQLPSWQVNMDPLKDTKNNALIQRLIQRVDVRVVRKSAKQQSEQIDTETIATTNNAEVPDSITSTPITKMGSMELAVANSLDDCVTVEPLFELRGMDVFLTNDTDPESNVGSHPWLVKQGLREVPTFTINILTQWGNILMYFKMPHWVNSLKSDAACLEEKTTDADDTRALKRFLRGGDDYRNARLMMIPSVVEGPMPVKMLAPPKREIAVHGSVLQLEWKSLEGDGKKQCPHLEVILDCMSGRPIRSMASLIKRYLQKLSIDVAVVVDKPDNQTEPEPTGCLGIWRFHHIDVSSCPQLPDRLVEEAKAEGELPDVLRASRALGLSKEQLRELVVEVQ